MPGHRGGTQHGTDQPYRSCRPSRGEQPGQGDATRHPKSEAGHHETGSDVETADPAPEHPARHGNGDNNGEEEPRPGQVIIEGDEVGDKIGREDRLDAVEGEAGK